MRPRTDWRTRLMAVALTVITAAVGAVFAAPGRALAIPDLPGEPVEQALLVQVTWEAGDGGMPAAPPDRTMGEILDAFGDHSEYFSQVSHGKFSGWSYYNGAGPIEISPPPGDFREGCDDPFLYHIRENADAILAAQVPNLDDYSLILYYFAHMPGCSAGWGGGGRVWLNGTLDRRIMRHELGHALGVGHADSLMCEDAQGNAVTLSNSCVSDEYGDPFSVMGHGSGSLSAVHQYDLGWLTGRWQNVPSTGGVFMVHPIEIDPQVLQVLRLTDGGVTLWIEYRQPVLTDAEYPAATQGVFVRAQLPGLAKSQLLDMTPHTDTFSDAKLPAGASWRNPLGTLKITVRSATLFGTEIAIEPELFRVPNVHGLTLQQATAALTAVGLVRGSVSFAADPTCENIGRVRSQSPGGGTHQPAGTAVRLTIGKEPKLPCP